MPITRIRKRVVREVFAPAMRLFRDTLQESGDVGAIRDWAARLDRALFHDETGGLWQVVALQHCAASWFNAPAEQAASARRVILYLHGGAFDRYHAGLSSLERAWVRRSIQGARVVLVLSESWADWLRQAIGHPDVRVLPNPVLPAVLPTDVPREAQTLLFLGRLEPEKGVFVLVEALARLAPAHPQLRAVLAGEGDLAGVRKAALDAGVAGRIELPGWVDGDAKARLLARAGIFVLPSRFEGLPMALLEAQAAGLPVVATRVGGIPQVVTDDDNGRLAEPDDVASLVAALGPLLDDAPRAARMGARGRERVLAGYGTARVGAVLEAAWGSLATK